jgi:hypothetical protein
MSVILRVAYDTAALPTGSFAVICVWLDRYTYSRGFASEATQFVTWRLFVLLTGWLRWDILMQYGKFDSLLTACARSALGGLGNEHINLITRPKRGHHNYLRLRDGIGSVTSEKE